MIRKPSNFTEMQKYFPDLAKIYKECFSAKPWNFALSEKESLMILKDAFELPGSIFCIDINGSVVRGAAIASPLRFHPEVSSLVERVRGDIITDCIYCQAIFVKPDWQYDGRGTDLHNYRLLVAKEAGFKYAVQRTSRDSHMYSVIQKTGFEKIGEYRVLHWRDYGNGPVLAYDKRIISIKKL